jgi:hypothetical protein
MFSFLMPILMELFKYQSGQALRNKFQISQEQIQRAVQEQITKILIKFFGGLICTVALCYSLIGLFDMMQIYINTLVYATEIKVIFFVLIFGISTLGLKAIFVDQKLNLVQPAPPPPPAPSDDINVLKSILSQFLEGLNQGVKQGRKKPPEDN